MVEQDMFRVEAVVVAARVVTALAALAACVVVLDMSPMEARWERRARGLRGMNRAHIT